MGPLRLSSELSDFNKQFLFDYGHIDQILLKSACREGIALACRETGGGCQGGSPGNLGGHWFKKLVLKGSYGRYPSHRVGCGYPFKKCMLKSSYGRYPSQAVGSKYPFKKCVLKFSYGGHPSQGVGSGYPSKKCVLWETSKSRRWLWVSIQIKHLAPSQPQASACHGVLSSQAYSANILLDHNGTNCQFYLLVFSVITEVGWDSRFSKVTCCLFQSFSLAMNCRWQRSHTVCSVRMFMCWGWALIVLARNTSKSGKIAITLSPEKSEHYLMIQCSNGSFFVVVGYSQDLWKLRLLSSLGY